MEYCLPAIDKPHNNSLPMSYNRIGGEYIERVTYSGKGTLISYNLPERFGKRPVNIQGLYTLSIR